MFYRQREALKAGSRLGMNCFCRRMRRAVQGQKTTQQPNSILRAESLQKKVRL